MPDKLRSHPLLNGHCTPRGFRWIRQMVMTGASVRYGRPFRCLPRIPV